MKFESFARKETLKQTHSVEKEPVPPAVEMAPSRRRDSLELSNKLARVALAALTLYGGINKSEMLAIHDANAAAFTVESQMLSENISTGKVRLSSGEEITIPKPGELFERVMVYTPEGKDPDRLIILFSQTHILSAERMKEYTAAERKTSLEEANESQRRIYQGLEQLVDAKTLKTVCSEGVTDWNMAKNMVRSSSEDPVSRIAKGMVPYFPGSDFEHIIKQSDEIMEQHYKKSGDIDEAFTSQKIFLESNPLVKQYVNEYKYVIGADDLLAMEGKLTLCPGEQKAAYDNLMNDPYFKFLESKPRTTWTVHDEAFYKKTLLEDRESGSIEMVMDSVSDKVTALSFGAHHDFTNNIVEWNSQHPDQQIGLVDVRTPIDTL